MSVVINSDSRCKKCNKEYAEIFNILGDYCAECWNEITHPDV